MKILGMMLLVVGMSGAAMAGAGWIATVPEIDAGSGVSALTLLSGALLVIKSRRRKE